MGLRIVVVVDRVMGVVIVARVGLSIVSDAVFGSVVRVCVWRWACVR